MADQGSITAMIQQIRDGDSSAVESLWHRYYQQLITLARRKLGDSPRRVADEDDVVGHAFNSFCIGAAAGRFPQLSDRYALWQTLVMLTARKAADQRKELARLKRGGGRVLGESAMMKRDSDDDRRGIDQVVGNEPTPEFAVQIAEEYGNLLQLLGDDSLRAVAVARMEGYSNTEIAAKLNVQTRTVERKLKLIREIWSGAENSASP